MSEEAPVVDGQVGDDSTPANDGQAQSVWYDSAPDEVKGFIENKGWDDPIKAVTSYQELEKYQGAGPDRLIKLPKEGEPMDEVYAKLGRPEAADKYEFNAPDGLKVDDNYMGAIKGAAYEAGVSQDAFAKLASTHAEYQQKAEQQYMEQVKEQQDLELARLKGEWGNAYAEREEIGRRFVSKVIPEGMDKGETLNKIEDAIGTAAMLKLFANAGEKAGVLEDQTPSADGDRPFGKSLSQLKADMKELMQDVQSDPERLKQYNTAKGNDYDRIKKLNELIASNS